MPFGPHHVVKDSAARAAPCPRRCGRRWKVHKCIQSKGKGQYAQESSLLYLTVHAGTGAMCELARGWQPACRPCKRSAAARAINRAGPSHLRGLQLQAPGTWHAGGSEARSVSYNRGHHEGLCPSAASAMTWPAAQGSFIARQGNVPVLQQKEPDRDRCAR